MLLHCCYFNSENCSQPEVRDVMKNKSEEVEMCPQQIFIHFIKIYKAWHTNVGFCKVRGGRGWRGYRPTSWPWLYQVGRCTSHLFAKSSEDVADLGESFRIAMHMIKVPSCWFHQNETLILRTWMSDWQLFEIWIGVGTTFYLMGPKTHFSSGTGTDRGDTQGMYVTFSI